MITWRWCDMTSTTRCHRRPMLWSVEPPTSPSSIRNCLSRNSSSSSAPSTSNRGQCCFTKSSNVSPGTGQEEEQCRTRTQERSRITVSKCDQVVALLLNVFIRSHSSQPADGFREPRIKFYYQFLQLITQESQLFLLFQTLLPSPLFSYPLLAVNCTVKIRVNSSRWMLFFLLATSVAPFNRSAIDLSFSIGVDFSIS